MFMSGVLRHVATSGLVICDPAAAPGTITSSAAPRPRCRAAAAATEARDQLVTVMCQDLVTGPARLLHSEFAGWCGTLSALPAPLLPLSASEAMRFACDKIGKLAKRLCVAGGARAADLLSCQGSLLCQGWARFPARAF